MIDIYTVSVFLKHKDKILILKRSEKVSTYPGNWGLIHGRLEPDEDPKKRAKKEIEEETGIKDAKFLKEGKPFVRVDKIYDIKWRIHPFLFESNSSKIKIDWENSDFKWIKPKELMKYGGVPGLAEDFKRIFGD